MISSRTLLARVVTSAALLAASFVIAGCGKSIASTETLPVQSFTSIDANAGAWKMIVLTAPTQIAVPAPAVVTDAGYRSELAQIKTAQASLTDAQKASISYWSGGGILRWNEVMRELAAKFDLPPAPNADGTYPTPSAANPFADPAFPFSNPPYSARAYSYVSVAQYEALKAAWYYKYQYKRAAPYRNDSGIKSLMPTSDLPSYPSEDAVEAGVNQTLLLSLFPAGVDEINAKSAEQQQVAMLSGRASASDIAAGFALGKAVATVLLQRASSDGMKNAGGNATVWQALADNASARGEIPWISQDNPARPPMLPVFGQVKAWMMSPADVIYERPGPPPSTSSTQMKQETAEVKNYVDNVTRDQLATVYKWADGASTFTPPGHWDYIAVPYIVKAGMSEVRTARTLALLNMALHDAAVGCWNTKYYYFNPRPTQMDPTIKTQVALPNFPSYESGHSVFSSAGADLLSYLFPDGADYFNAQMKEASMSRLYAGIHFRSDIAVGMDHGKRIGEYTVRFAKTDGAD